MVEPQSPHCERCVFLGIASAFMGAACWKCSESKLYAYKLHAYEATLPFYKVRDMRPQNLLATAARSLDPDLPNEPEIVEVKPTPSLSFRVFRWFCYRFADVFGVLI